MEVNWMILGIVVFCAIILIVYLIWKNLKDKKELEKFLNEEAITKKKLGSDDDVNDEL